MDFGLALAHGGEDEVEDVWATPFYVPPEKLDGEPDDFRGDIYSLGATLFHAVAGSPPFDANTASMQDLKEIKAQPLQLTDAAPHASAQMAKLIDKMMSYDPAKRQQSYDELVGEIDALLEDSAGSGSRAGKRVGERNRSKSVSVVFKNFEAWSKKNSEASGGRPPPWSKPPPLTHVCNKVIFCFLTADNLQIVIR